MYLYFNKYGTLTTAIPHGEPVRQGSYLNIYILLDEDFFTSKNENINNFNVNVELVFPKNPSVSTTKICSIGGPNLYIFEKTDDSEMTYDLVNGQKYWTYHFRFTPNESTMNDGKITACVSIQKISIENYEDVETTFEEELFYFGKTDIYVEKTFGESKKIVNESSLHYKNLVMQINNINSNKVSKKGDNIININASDFTRENDSDNYKTYEETSESIIQLLMNNKYQLVTLKSGESSYTYHQINDDKEKEIKKYTFIRYVDFQTISILIFDSLYKKWFLYNNINFLSDVDIENWVPADAVTSQGNLIREKLIVGSNGLKSVKSSDYSISDLVEIANGRRKVFVINSLADSFTDFSNLPNSQPTYPESFSYELTDDSIQLIDKSSVKLKDLKNGDSIITTDENEFDYFVSISEIDNRITFFKLLVDIENLENYLTKVDASNIYARKDELFSKDYDDLINKPIINEKNDNSISIIDNNYNIIAKINENGISSTNFSENGKNLKDKYLLKENVFIGTYEEYIEADSQKLIPIGCMVYITDR